MALARITSAVLAWALVLAPRPSLAEPGAEPPASEPGTGEPSEQDAQVARAMDAYQRGTQNYNLAQYEAALADFTEAASLYASPDFQYNIGLCYEKLGKHEEAIRAFAAYLRAKPDAEDRPNVENRIHALEQALEQEAEQRRREAEAAEAARLAAASAEPEPAPVQPADEPEPTPVGRPLIIAGAALIGLGAAVALGGGIGFGVAAGRRSRAIDEVQTGGNPEELTFGDTQQLEREGKRLEGLQIGMAAGGAVVAVTGAALLALGLRKQQAAKTQARLGPALGRSGAGLVLTGRF